MFFDPSKLPVAEGDIVGAKYRIERVIGAGGMGVVVAASHVELDQRVAIKFLFQSAIGTLGAQERFLREARAAARLQSPHVARVIDVGALDNGVPYMVMEFLEGTDLGQWLTAHGKLSVNEAVRLVLEACDAVSEAHSLGIIHRDLKPSNLFLCRKHKGSTFVKVLDFGISKIKTLPGSAALTQTGDMVGSPSYMAPEQIRDARGVDERTDIWAMGVILYELITANLPFPATNIPQLCSLVLEKAPVPLAEYRTDLPPLLERIIYRCIEKDPSRRFQSLDELMEALASFASDDAVASTKLASKLALSNLGTSATLAVSNSPGASLQEAPQAASASGSSPSDAPHVAVSGFRRTQSSQPAPAIKAKKGTYRWLGVAGALLLLAIAALVVLLRPRGTPVAMPLILSAEPGRGQLVDDALPLLSDPAAGASQASASSVAPPALSSSAPTTSAKPLKKAVSVVASVSALPVLATPPPKNVDPLLPAERK